MLVALQSTVIILHAVLYIIADPSTEMSAKGCVTKFYTLLPTFNRIVNIHQFDATVYYTVKNRSKPTELKKQLNVASASWSV